MRVGILVDNPFRDLPGLTLLAWKLCQEGISCQLIPVNLRENEIWPLAPDFLLLNHFRTIYEPLVERLLSAGIDVGILDTEGSDFSSVPKGAHRSLENEKEMREYIKFQLWLNWQIANIRRICVTVGIIDCSKIVSLIIPLILH